MKSIERIKTKHLPMDSLIAIMMINGFKVSTEAIEVLRFFNRRFNLAYDAFCSREGYIYEKANFEKALYYNGEARKVLEKIGSNPEVGAVLLALFTDVEEQEQQIRQAQKIWQEATNLKSAT